MIDGAKEIKANTTGSGETKSFNPHTQIHLSLLIGRHYFSMSTRHYVVPSSAFKWAERFRVNDAGPSLVPRDNAIWIGTMEMAPCGDVSDNFKYIIHYVILPKRNRVST